MDLVPHPEQVPDSPHSDHSGGGSAVSLSSPSASTVASPSRYESQKRRDWNTFGQYLRNHRPPLSLARCSGAHVLEFLRYLDQFGKTKVHTAACPFFGHPAPPAPCPCPLRQAWGSLDALVGRLRAAYEEHGGRPEANPFGARAVRLYLREVRDTQAKARGIAYEKKRRKRPSSSSAHKQQQQQAVATTPPPPPPRTASPALSSERSDSHVQQQQHQHAVVPPAETQAHTHHFFIPHPQFLHHHGHFSLLPPGNAGLAVNGAAAGTSSAATTVSSSNGDEIALAMAAEAEAHAAGCLLPLSVFH